MRKYKYFYISYLYGENGAMCTAVHKTTKRNINLFNFEKFVKKDKDTDSVLVLCCTEISQIAYRNYIKSFEEQA